MLVFIDESGDPGFKLEKGSSPIFVVSMVAFADADGAQRSGELIDRLRAKLRVRPEFKFNKCKQAHKDAFFETIRDCPFRARFVVVEKRLIRSAALRSVKESFYKFFVRVMMQHDGGTLNDAKVVIDGSGDRSFKQQFKAYLRRHLAEGCVRSCELKNSKRDALLQLADMCAGAVARSYRPDFADCSRWRDVLQRNGQIDDVWEFK
jgi:hypothetical protein